MLLNYSLDAGHSAGRSIRSDVGDLAVDLHFLFGQLGIEAPWKTRAGRQEAAAAGPDGGPDPRPRGSAD